MYWLQRSGASCCTQWLQSGMCLREREGGGGREGWRMGKRDREKKGGDKYIIIYVGEKYHSRP